MAPLLRPRKRRHVGLNSDDTQSTNYIESRNSRSANVPPETSGPRGKRKKACKEESSCPVVAVDREESTVIVDVPNEDVRNLRSRKEAGKAAKRLSINSNVALREADTEVTEFQLPTDFCGATTKPGKNKSTMKQKTKKLSSSKSFNTSKLSSKFKVGGAFSFDASEEEENEPTVRQKTRKSTTTRRSNVTKPASKFEPVRNVSFHTSEDEYADNENDATVKQKTKKSIISRWPDVPKPTPKLKLGKQDTKKLIISKRSDVPKLSTKRVVEKGVSSTSSVDGDSDNGYIRKPRRSAVIARKNFRKQNSYEAKFDDDDFIVESPASDSEDVWDENETSSEGDSKNDVEEEEEDSNTHWDSQRRSKKMKANKKLSGALSYNFKFKDQFATSYLKKLFDDWEKEGSNRKSSKQKRSKLEACSKKKDLVERKSTKSEIFDNSSFESEDEWEDVEGGDEHVVVTLKESPRIESEEDKKSREARQEIVRRLNQKQLNSHKVHLLCYIGHLKVWTRSLMMDTFLKGLCLSLIPTRFVNTAVKKFDISCAQSFMKWFTSCFSFNDTAAIAVSGPMSVQLGRLKKLVSNKIFGNDRDAASALHILLKEEIEATNSATCEVFVREKRKSGEVSNDSTLKSTENKVRKSTMCEEKRLQKGKRRNSIALSDGTPKTSGKDALKRNYWVEYWNSEKNLWICLDPWKGSVNLPESIEADVASPMHYVLAIDNALGMCEVTARYASRYLNHDFRLLRVDSKWWKKTLHPFLSNNDKRMKLEESAIQNYLSAKPMPSSFGEFKNHPLYILDKDVLKYDAIYPPDTKPIGEFRNCKIYPRSSVHNLQSALNWLKEIRSVKEGEEPYKMVTARPNPKVPKEKRIEKTTGLFGYWQTEPFKPPKPVNGRIPRNEHGNIYLYKRCMLPEDCVYLNLEGVYGIARRLNIECASCVVGWDFHKGGNHPVIEGCAVLKKDEKKLRQAWAKEYDKKRYRADHRRRERAKKNWRRLYRGIVLMKKMRAKFMKDDSRVISIDEELVDGSKVLKEVDSEEPADDDFAFAWPRTDFNLPLSASGIN